MWHWRGITAFRLLEQLAAGKGGEVDAYLKWAASQKLTVVRVLVMAKHLFELPPATGRAHLDDLLTRARRHALHVEIVPLADTAAFTFSVEEHLRETGAIAARHPNAIVELANEPWHQTHAAPVRDSRTLASWLPLIPAEIPTAMGAAADRPDENSAGDFVTFHFPRSNAHQHWGHVIDLATGREALRRLGKPLINDEPIGAGPELQPGRRDDNPERFRAAALLTRMIGMGATFHYEGGLHARIPSGPELAAFAAWQEAWTRLPADIERAETFGVAGAKGSAADVAGAVAAWDVQRADEAWLLVVLPSPELRITWRAPWRQVEESTWRESRLVRASRRPR